MTEQETQKLPTVLIFDVVVHTGTIIYKSKEDPLEFWAFKPRSSLGDYICFRCDFTGNMMPKTEVYGTDDMPLFAIEQPDTNIAALRDFEDWLYADGVQL